MNVLLYDLFRRLVIDPDQVLRILKQNKIRFRRAIELGCGYGHVPYALARAFPRARVEGFEIDKNRVREAQKKFRSANLRFFYADAAYFRRKAAYDLVLALDLAHHMPPHTHDALLDNVAASLKLGGFFLFSDIAAESRVAWTSFLHDLVLNKCRTYPRTTAEWKKKLESRNFKTITCFKQQCFLYPHFFILARKTRR